MKIYHMSLALVLCLLGTANALDLAVSGYSMENYAQYDSATSSKRMVIDDSGNLYLSHETDGKIVQVDTNQQASTLVSGTGTSLYGIEWGGGTSFGNYLYVAERTGTWTGNISKVDLNGNVTYFANMDNPRHGVQIVGIDRTGNYGGNMFSSGTGQDRLYSVDTNGQASLFVDWPPHTDGGGTRGIDFDITGKYDEKMYLAITLQDDNPHLSGLFAINPDGSHYRFCNDIVQAHEVKIDGIGSYFDGDMFVVGTDTFGGTNNLWRVYEDGTSELFMTGLIGNNAVEFGLDGSMYVSAYSWGADEVTIVRVVPEPATVLLISLGALCLRKRNA